MMVIFEIEHEKKCFLFEYRDFDSPLGQELAATNPHSADIETSAITADSSLCGALFLHTLLLKRIKLLLVAAWRTARLLSRAASSSLGEERAREPVVQWPLTTLCPKTISIHDDSRVFLIADGFGRAP